MKSVSFSMDGKKLTCPSGTSILEAARRGGIRIPTLCDHPDLKPYGACRLCLVEDEKSGRLMASCVTPAAPDMALQSRSERVIRHRRNIIRMMIAEHPESCIVCNKGNRCELRQFAAELGIGEPALYPMPNVQMVEEVNPFIVRDLSKCILCGKCIRADHELVVAGAIDYNLRGFASRPATLHNVGLEASTCTFCGTCVSMCPTGALSTRNVDFVGTPEREVDTVCGFCGVGCRLTMGIQDDRVVEAGPTPGVDSVNRATLCVRGHFAHDFLNCAGRLRHPMRRVDGVLSADTWDACLDEAAARLLEIKREHGPQSIGFFGSARCTNEENYLFQKIARVTLETGNIDNGAYGTGRSAAKLIDHHFDGSGRYSRLADLENADAIFVIGANPCHSSPVAGYHLRRAAKRGTTIVVADPRATELARMATCWLAVAPGRDLDLINGLSAALYQMRAYDPSFIDRYTEGFSVYRYGLESVNIEQSRRSAGLPEKALEAAADLLRGRKIAFVLGNGIFQQPASNYCVNALINLALMTGSLGARGTGFFRLSRYSNQMGAIDMGSVPDALPGRRPLKDEAARRPFEKAWHTRLSPDRGLNIVRMIEEAEKGNLKALVVMGENPLRDLPDPGRVEKALAGLDLLIAVDILEGETTRLADIVLPGAAHTEKGGSFTSMEGRIQHFAPAVPPPGEARPDWEILSLLCEKLGMAERYDSPDRIHAEIRRLVPGYNAADNDPAAVVQDTGGLDLFTGKSANHRITFLPLPSLDDSRDNDEFPFTAIFGTIRCHLGGGTRTSASARIAAFTETAQAMFSPDDADRLGFQDGDTVEIASVQGVIQRCVAIDRGLPADRIFIPLAVAANDAMKLIPLSQLGRPDAPGWKTCRVKAAKVSTT